MREIIGLCISSRTLYCNAVLPGLEMCDMYLNLSSYIAHQVYEGTFYILGHTIT